MTSVSSPSLCRQWISSMQEAADDGPRNFTIMTYNILSEELLKRSSYFCKIKPEFWQREARHAKLMEELDCLNPDILCLQEVDSDYWVNCLERNLQSRGYHTLGSSWREHAPIECVVTCALEASFARIPVTSPLSADTVANVGSGCLSDLVASRIREFTGDQHSAQELLRYADAPQRYSIAKLEHRDSGRRLVVGNAHVSYQRPAKFDLRAAQAVAFVNETAAVASGEAFLVCGDFNSTPDSLAYQSVVQTSSPHVPSAAIDQQLPLLKSTSAMLTQMRENAHRSDIGSAYLSVFGKEPDCTLNLTNNSGCVDFIFYEKQRLRPLAALEVPSWYILRDKDCVPDAFLASDHLSLAAKFCWV